MAKSMRSKRKKRLRAIRREMVGPLVDLKDAAKLAVLEAALAAPKLPVRAAANSSPEADTTMELDMAEEEEPSSTKPFGRKLKKKLKLARNKRSGGGGKGKFKKRHI